MLDLPRLARSFKAAVQGFYHAVCREQNLRIHLCFCVLVVVMGFYFDISTTEWCMIIFCMGLVCSLELFNTAIERTVDKAALQPNQTQSPCELGRQAKDSSAAAVLFASVAAAIIGLLIFVPKFLNLWPSN